MLTDDDLFCEVCQLVLEECPGHESLHSLSVTEIPQSVNGNNGDTSLSPAIPGPTSSEYAPVTAVTPPGNHRPRHARNGDSNGDFARSLSPDTGRKRVTSWTLRTLLEQDFPEPRWVVKGLIPQGLTVFAGAPKAGKSWVALGVCMAVAYGGKAFGAIEVREGDALYLALEDHGRRLQDRSLQMLAGVPGNDRLTLSIECPAMHQGGLLKIADWIEKAADPRVVFIDVLERFRGPAPQGISAYAADYQAISAIKELADAFDIGIVVLHHVRKITSDDFLSEISGTLGISGAADTICALKRRRGELTGTLQVTGRDVDEETYALRFDKQIGLWQLIGLESEHGLAETRRKILTHVRLNEGAKPAEIALATGLTRDLAKTTCARMEKDGQLDSDGKGRYFAPIRSEQP